MKKNLVLSVLAAAGMLFATSCTQDDLRNGSANSDYIDATFTLATEDGIGTRAIGNGAQANVVACAVYDANTQAELPLLRQYRPINSGTATYSVRLAKGKNYRVAFFAYHDNDDDHTQSAHYDVRDMKNIVVKDSQVSNDEKRDAFTAYVDIEEGETMNAYSEAVVLQRPFAQLNLGIDQVELDAAAAAGLVVKESKIVVGNVYKVFSAYENAVPTTAALESMEFNFNDIPGEKLIIGTKEYTYLAMNYILVGNKGTEKGLTDIEFVWKTEQGVTNNPTTHFVNVPAQRNYRTNIVGKLLTSPTDFNISIDQRFDGDKGEDIVTIVTKEVATAAELQAAINAAVEAGQYIIRMTEDIQANEIVVEQNTDVEIFIDGQGHELDAHVVVDGNNGIYGTEGLTLENIKFNYSGNAGEIVNAPFSDAQGNNNQYAHNIIIKNCEFSATTNAANITAVRTQQAFDVKVIQSKAAGLHSFAQIAGGDTFEFDQITSTCTRGLSLNAYNVKISNSTIVANDDKYGIRHSTQIDNDVLKIANCNVTAFIPVAVRNNNSITPITKYEVYFEGTNVLTRLADSEFDIAISNTTNEYDTCGQRLTTFADGVVTVRNADLSWEIYK